MSKSAFEQFLAEISTPKENVFEMTGENPVEESQSSKTEEGKEGESSSDNKQTEEQVPFNQNPRWKSMVAKNKKLESEVQKLSTIVEKLPENYVQSDNEEVPYEWLATHGDNENTRKAWPLQKKLLDKVKEEAKQEVRNEFIAQQTEAEQEKVKWSQYIDSQLESLEDEHGVDLTSETPAAKKARTEFLGLVQRLSPKDDDGEITGFADFSAAWDYYQSKKEKPDNKQTTRKQELAARSMSRSNEAPTAEDVYQSGEGFNGIRNRLGI